MGYEQKVVVVTGASRGIGAGVVEAFRGKGYRVVATSRSIEASSGPDLLAIPGDVGSPETAERVVSEGLARFGRIDTLINNAGIFVSKPFTEYTPDDYAAILATNLAGFYHVTQRVIAHMESKGSGHVVNITASLVDAPSSRLPAALAALTKGG